MAWDDDGEAHENELRERARTWAAVCLLLSAGVVAWVAYVVWLR